MKKQNLTLPAVSTNCVAITVSPKLGFITSQRQEFQSADSATSTAKHLLCQAWAALCSAFRVLYFSWIFSRLGRCQRSVWQSPEEEQEHCSPAVACLRSQQYPQTPCPWHPV